MKILYLTHNVAGVGGSYIRAFSLATHVAGLGHEVTLMASRSSPGLRMIRERIDDLDQIQMPDLMLRGIRNGGLSPFDIFFRSLWGLSHPFDIVHGFDHRPAVLLPSLLAQRLKGATFVSDWADLWGSEGIAGQRQGLSRRTLGTFDHLVESRFRLWADGITAISSDLDRRLSEQGIPTQKRMRLPPGANLNIIQPMDKKEARKSLKLPENVPIAAFTGFAPYDREFLVRAVLGIVRQHPSASVISSGAVIHTLQQEAHKLGFSNRIVQFGTLPYTAIGMLLGAADVLLLPYLDTAVNRGRFPNKFGDYLAAGRPIVTHRTGDLGAIVEQEEVGIYSSEDPVVFAQDVMKLFDSPEELTRLGFTARRFAERRWSWEQWARDTVDFYQRIRS